MNGKKQKLTTLESLTIGSIVGFANITINLPLWAIKIRIQCDLPFTVDPRILYKGYTMLLATTVPIAALEIFNTSRIEKILNEEKTVSSQERVFSSFLGGISSSLIGNPLNLIATQQHKHGTTPLNTTKNMIRQFGIKSIYIGLPASTMTHGLFACAFYGIFPIIKEYARKYTHSEGTAYIFAGVLAGISTAVLTHPLDLIKTIQHRNSDQKGEHSFIYSFRKIYKNKGSVGLFKGFVPRTLGMCSTVLVAGTTADVVESIYRNNKS